MPSGRFREIKDIVPTKQLVTVCEVLSNIPLRRFSTALDVVNAALYLASDEAAFISGACIEADGGRCV